MLCGCIDIGTNTTRVLVAEARDGRLIEVLAAARVHPPRARADAGRGDPRGPHRGHRRGGRRSSARLAEEAGAQPIRTVATAVIRRAANQDEFCRAMREHGGVDVHVLDGEEEARLAFLGATRTLGRPLEGRVGVVDVGGGSTEIAVGTLAGGVEWSTSLPFGSGVLADRFLRSDPPSAQQLAEARAYAEASTIAPPPVDTAVAVGGSAASLRRLVGPVLDAETLDRALAVLQGAPAAQVAARYHLEEGRVKLLPAGLLALGAAGRALDQPLQIGNGGLREGVLLELAGTA